MDSFDFLNHVTRRQDTVENEAAPIDRLLVKLEDEFRKLTENEDAFVRHQSRGKSVSIALDDLFSPRE